MFNTLLAITGLSNKAEIAQEVDRALIHIGVICTGFMILITIAMLYFIFKYHRSKADTIEQIESHHLLETIWIVVPLIFVMYMFYVGLVPFLKMRAVPEGAKVIQVVGSQWKWQFTYEDEDEDVGILTNNLYLPEDTDIKFVLNSHLDIEKNERDVLHSFYLPDFRQKEDVVPGTEHYMWIHTPKVDDGVEQDEYNIFCAEFCGKDHAKMLGKVFVVRQERFDAEMAKFVAANNKPITIANGTDPTSKDIQDLNAKNLFAANCAACHGEDGNLGANGARNLTMLDDKWKQGTRNVDIFKTITMGVPGTAMASYAGMNPKNRLALMHYVAAFYKGSDRPESTNDDYQTLWKEYKLDQVVVKAKLKPLADAMATLLKQTSQPHKPDMTLGKIKFQAICATCHGANGEGAFMKMGDKPMAPSLTTPNLWALVDDDFFIKTVKGGRPHTGMIPRDDVNENDIRDIIAWLKDISVKTGIPATITAKYDRKKSFHGNPQKGKKAYLEKICHTCHGVDGMGYSTKAVQSPPVMIFGPAIGAPGYVDRVSEDFIFQTVKHGRPPSLMAPLGLTDQEIGDVIAYLRVLGAENNVPVEEKTENKDTTPAH